MATAEVVAPASELLRVQGLSKTFAGNRVLADVDLDIRLGEVHALVGHNGSGKSTLIKVLSGYHHPDPGAQFWLGGQEVGVQAVSRGTDSAAGVHFVHQDLGLVLELSAVDNFALHAEFVKSRLGRVKWREQRAVARKLMSRFAVDFDVTAPLSAATPVERTIVAIAAALQGSGSDGGILVLDEPTAVLPPHEVSRLAAITRNLTAAGSGILYVSHRLDEVFELADRVTVLRGGHRVGTYDVADLTKRELVELMLGVEADPDFRAVVPVEDDAPTVLEVADLHGRYLRGANLTLRKGEVLGIAGYPDSGRDELPRLLTDHRAAATKGRIRSAGDVANLEYSEVSSWRDRSVILLPPERAKEGIIGPMTVGDNLSLSVLDNLGRPWLLSQRREQDFVGEWMDRLDVLGGGVSAPVRTLSGGNQQKVLLGRSLAREPRVLVLCEPTAGVDIGARQLIYAFVAEQVRRGLSVLVASSDVGDLVAMCSRVLILDNGAVVKELIGADLTEPKIIQSIEDTESELGR